MTAVQMVNSLQQRVRTKMRKAAAENAQRTNSGSAASAANGDQGPNKEVNSKRMQWLAIQAKARRLGSPAEFEAVTTGKVAAVQPLIDSIRSFGCDVTTAPDDEDDDTERGATDEHSRQAAQMLELARLVDACGDQSQWFCGGTKEMHERFPVRIGTSHHANG